MKDLSKGKRNEYLNGSETPGIWKEVTEVDILWKAYEIYLDNIIPCPGELPDWLRVEAAINKSEPPKSIVSKFLKRPLAF